MRLLKVAFFLSGATGLIYEVVWTRLLSDVTGSTAVAMTSVFSVFMVALAMGALLIGRTAKRGREGLVLYGQLEIAIGLTALAASLALIRGRSWIAFHLPQTGVFAADLVVHLLTAVALIGIPVFLMGGTLPAALNAVEQWTRPREVVAHLYGLNTLGAACGTLAAGFVLIWTIGLTLTLAVAITLNLAIGVVAWVVGSRLDPVDAARPMGDMSRATSSMETQHGALWLALAFFSGFAVLGYEILWGRVAKFLLGDRTLAISTLLFVVISALGLAGLLASRVSRWFGDRGGGAVLTAVGWTMLAGGCLHLLAVPLANATAAGGGLLVLLPLGSEFVRRVATIGVLVFPPIFALGLAFPLLIRGARDLDLFPGLAVGRLYFVNAMGGALGAAVAAYALSRWLGTWGGFLAMSSLLFVVSVPLLARGGPSGGPRWPRLVLVAPLLLLALAFLGFPRSLVHLRAGEILVESVEDEYGVQVLTRTDRGALRVRNNRLQLIFDLGHPDTTHAQQMAAHLSVLLAADCRDVINIGTGYGITAGTFALYADLRSIETVEILPFLVERQHLFAQYNFSYWNDGRVRLRQGDGRHHLVASRKTYDVVSVNVLDPYLPGSSSLYTTDFYRSVKERLRPGGVMTQLLWGNDLLLLVRGLKSVFADVLFFPAYGGTAYNVIAFRDPVDFARIRFRSERLTAAAREQIGLVSRADGSAGEPDVVLPALLAVALEASARLQRHVDPRGPLHTDDHPLLEYRWAHGVPNVSILDSPHTQP